MQLLFPCLSSIISSSPNILAPWVPLQCRLLLGAPLGSVLFPNETLLGSPPNLFQDEGFKEKKRTLCCLVLWDFRPCYLKIRHFAQRWLKLKVNENQQMQKGARPEFPFSDHEQKLLRNKGCPTSLSQEVLWPWRRWKVGTRMVLNKKPTPFIPHILTVPWSATLRGLKPFSFVLSLLWNVLFLC